MANDNRIYYVLCGDNCKFEGMTKEQIYAAIEEATGNVPTGIDDAFITQVKESNANAAVKFWVGTEAQFNALSPLPTWNTFQLRRDNNGKWYAITDHANDPEALLSAHEQSNTVHYDLRQITHNITLTAAGWTGSASPFTQAVTITGLELGSNVKIDLEPDSTALAQMIEDSTAAIYIQNANGTLTAYAIDAKPTVDLTVQATIKYILQFIGTVEAVANLPASGNHLGDVYHVTADGRDYVWNGSAWQIASNIITDSEIDTILNS